MKTKLLFIMFLLVCLTDFGTARADKPEYVGSQLTSGSAEYFIYNVATGKFLTAGASWGTDACVDDDGLPITVSYVDEGSYSLNSGVGNGRLFIDDGRLNFANKNSINFTITEVDSENHIYTIKYSDAEGWLICDPSSTLNSSKNWLDGRNRCELTTTDPSTTNTNGQWKFVSKADRIEALSLSSATTESPVELTFLVPAAKIIKDDSRNSSAWTGLSIGNGQVNSYAIADYNTEQWSNNTDDLNTYQSLSGLPKGKYMVQCQGFYRHGEVNNSTEQQAVLYANNSAVTVSTPLPTYASGGQDSNTNYGNTTTTNSEGKYIPSSQGNAAYFFVAGHYTTEKTATINVANSGYLTIGVKTTGRTNKSWTVFDNVRLYYAGPLTTDEEAELIKDVISTNNGDATTLITNANCNNGDGWTLNTGATASTYGSESWRGTGDKSDQYLDMKNFTSVSQTLQNMPAGYYRLVAALRTYDSNNTITPQLGTATGTTFYGMGYGSTGSSMINTQGVQMPADESFNGFGSNRNTRGWQWGSVDYQLTTAGDLTVQFNLTGTNWKCVDDVHLYYSETADGFYQITDSYNDLTSNTKVVGCNIVLTNPNTIVSSDEAIITASGNQLNNNLVSGNVANLVLFDGNEFTATGDFTATQATLYRSINLGESSHAFATVCAPFAITGGATGTFFEPTSLNDGTLTFGAQPTPQAGKPYLLKATAAVTTLTGSGEVKATPVDNGTGVTMKGTFANIASVNYNDYVLSGSSLYKVNSTVSLAPFRAYFTIPGAEARSLSISFDDETTGISAAPAVNNNLKANNAYDLQGRPVTNGDLPKGIYIVGGKKVVVK